VQQKRAARVEPRGHHRYLRGYRDGVDADLDQQIAERLALERHLADDALEGDHGERPEIAAAVDRLRPLRLLRAHVARRPEDRAGARGVALGAAGPVAGDLGAAEVEDLGDLLVVVLHEEDVVGLEIPMDHVALVGLGEGAADVRDDADRVGEGEALEAREAGGEALPFEELHRDEGHALVHAVVEDLDDVRAAQRRGESAPRCTQRSGRAAGMGRGSRGRTSASACAWRCRPRRRDRGRGAENEAASSCLPGSNAEGGARAPNGLKWTEKSRILTQRRRDAKKKSDFLRLCVESWHFNLFGALAPIVAM